MARMMCHGRAQAARLMGSSTRVTLLCAALLGLFTQCRGFITPLTPGGMQLTSSTGKELMTVFCADFGSSRRRGRCLRNQAWIVS